MKTSIISANLFMGVLKIHKYKVILQKSKHGFGVRVRVRPCISDNSSNILFIFANGPKMVLQKTPISKFYTHLFMGVLKIHKYVTILQKSSQIVSVRGRGRVSKIKIKIKIKILMG